MNKMILFGICLIQVFCCNLYGKNKEEEILLDKYQHLSNWGIKYNSLDLSSDLILEYSDSLEKANKEFTRELLHALNSEDMLDYNFDLLKKTKGISIVKSKDGNIRFFSWDTFSGGTMNQYEVIVQYKDNSGRVYSKVINSGSLFMKSEFYANGPNISIDKVYDITRNNKTIYLTSGEGKCEVMCISKQINTFCIEDATLKMPNILFDNQIKTNTLLINYRTSDLKIKWSVDYEIQPNENVIMEPIIPKSGHIIQKKYKRYTIE